MGNNTGKYVADVFDIDKVIEEHGKKIMLIAGVGAGKSSWVKDVLTQKGNVLFVTSRRAKVDEDIENSVFSTFVKEPENEKYSLITNAKLARILQNAYLDSSMTVDEFLDYYDYIVVDEVHSIATDSSFARSSFDLFTFIEYAAETDHTVIVMTGTPEPVEFYFKRKKWYIVDYRKICNYVRPGRIDIVDCSSKYTGIKNALINGEKVIYFVNHTGTIRKTMQEMKEKHIGEIPNIAVVVADKKWEQIEKDLKAVFPEYNADLSRRTYKNIIENQRLPEECQVLLTTSRLKEGIDILNENICMLCDNHILSNLIQFFGRVRIGGGKVYIVKDARQFSVHRNTLLYRYALKNEIEAANKFIQKQLLMPDEYTEIIKLIEHVERNPYIRYNFIKGCFELNYIKMSEEKRLEKIVDWKWELKKYCDQFGITYLYLSDKQKSHIFQDALKKIAKEETQFFDGEIDRLRRYILLAYGIKNKKIGTINEKLEQLNAPVRILNQKCNKKENRNKTYWKVVEVTEMEKR